MGLLRALTDLAGELGRGEAGVAVPSAGVIAAACTMLIGGDTATFIALNHAAINCSITSLAVGRTRTSLTCFNDHSHLRAAGIDASFR